MAVSWSLEFCCSDHHLWTTEPSIFMFPLTPDHDCVGGVAVQS